MPLNTTEKQFESDIAASLLSPAGGYTRNGDCYDPKLGLFADTLIRKGIKTLDEVPARLRSTVKALLAEVEADA